MPNKLISVSDLSGEYPRLDVFLTEQIPGLSRSQLHRLITNEKVKVNGSPSKPGFRLHGGENIEIEWEEAENGALIPESMPLEWLYRDDDIAVLNKASGIVVHPGAGNRKHTLVHALLHEFPDIAGVGPPERPGIVHRLDKETSGVLVVALNLQAYEDLQRQFRMREIFKSYLGLVKGRMPRKEGMIDWSIGRHGRHGDKMSTKTRKPRSAVTQWEVREEMPGFTLLNIRPLTGRTHQIRVHLAASGRPLIGDTRYGRIKTEIPCPRLFLHAHRLELNHPQSGDRRIFSAPLPHDLEAYLCRIRKSGVSE